MTQKHIHFIGIGGIGISAVARYYKSQGASISGSSDEDSVLIHDLQKEGMDIVIGHKSENIPIKTDKIIYTKAILGTANTFEEWYKNNIELVAGFERSIPLVSYPDALAEIVNTKKCIAVSGTHGKSTTTSMLGILLANGEINASTIVWTQVPQLHNSNFYYGTGEYFVIEACEYKRSFLKYFPFITVITNIEVDHLDYYKDLDDYLSAFRSLQEQTSEYVILNGNDTNCLKLKDETKKQYFVYETYFICPEWEKIIFPKLHLQVPGNHIAFDAKLVFVVGKIVWLEDDYIIHKLNSYTGAWRRSEIIRTTENGNILLSDYGHHPTEIWLTLDAIKNKYNDKKIFVVFQPHQYSRTIELLEWFKTCFDSADSLIVPDIYFSRDKKEDVKYMTTECFVEALRLRYPFAQNGNWIENTLKIVREYDATHPKSSIVILLGAGNIDDLRHDIL